MVTDTVTRKGIDAVNKATGDIDRDNPFSQVIGILEGNASSRQQRKPNQIDICDTTLPGNSLISQNNPSVSVSISPNSYDAGSNAASNPLIALVQLAYQTLLQANPKRQRIIIQNVGSTNLFIIFGIASSFNAKDATLYHVKIPSGQSYIDEQWVGRIDIVSDAGNGVVSAVETWRNQNI